MWSVYGASSAAEASHSAVHTGLGEITLGLSLAICSALGTHTVALRQPERPNKHRHLILNNRVSKREKKNAPLLFYNYYCVFYNIMSFNIAVNGITGSKPGSGCK